MKITLNIVALGALSALPTSATASPDLVSAIEKIIDEQFPWKKIALDHPVELGSCLRSVPVRFEQIKVVFQRRLSAEEIARVAGCLGYALVETLRGEDLGEPRVTFPAGACGKEFTVLVFDWDSSSSIRSVPDTHRAFEVASVYVPHGSRIRTTNRAGEGTRGTRLVEGIGGEAPSFWVR